MRIIKLKYLLIIFIVLFITNCSIYFQPINPKSDYNQYIKFWQQREKWDEEKVDDIINKCIKISKYKEDKYDHWQTYKQFKKTFKGDCEDFAAFIIGTLEYLNCPFENRIEIIRTFSGDHAIVKVKINNKIKIYNTLPMPGDFIDIKLSKFIVGYDKINIYYSEWKI